MGAAQVYNAQPIQKYLEYLVVSACRPVRRSLIEVSVSLARGAARRAGRIWPWYSVSWGAPAVTYRSDAALVEVEVGLSCPDAHCDSTLIRAQARPRTRSNRRARSGQERGERGSGCAMEAS